MLDRRSEDIDPTHRYPRSGADHSAIPFDIILVLKQISAVKVSFLRRYEGGLARKRKPLLVTTVGGESGPDDSNSKWLHYIPVKSAPAQKHAHLRRFSLGLFPAWLEKPIGPYRPPPPRGRLVVYPRWLRHQPVGQKHVAICPCSCKTSMGTSGSSSFWFFRRTAVAGQKRPWC